MLPVFALLGEILRTLWTGLFGWLRHPQFIYFPVMLTLVISMVTRQHARQASLEEHLFGEAFSNPMRQVLTSLGFGFLGGLFASTLMFFLGVALSEELGIIYVWPVVLVLMLINPRFMCFAYGGGVVGAISLLLRALAGVWPGLRNVGLLAGFMAIDISSLMALVALLHLTESLLILISGHINASPVAVRGPGGRIVGGFMLQRFWPLPMAALFAAAVGMSELGDGVLTMPDWWPLLRPAVELDPEMVLLFFPMPIIAALGYSDIAVSSTPKAKSRWSARNLMAYSLALLLLAILSGRWTQLQIAAVLLAPLGHEYLIQAGNRREWAGRPLYSAPERGVKLLAVMPNSAAQAVGLGEGWIITNVNGMEVNSRWDLANALQLFPGLAEIEAVSPRGETRVFRIHQRQGKLGLVPVPDSSQHSPYLRLDHKGFFLRLWDKLKNRRSGA
ncbi:MAG: PDZ domain-containing protein [Firmicutes bacterium]|nr:PDZ domain-containing protein [Bacillota bacterium]HOB35308.1 PDZ domain-containing protein [Bacillota bacterium]HPZ90440.1 PDZ domain-containing protein [Bacillota bacterium]HQE01448.1 PDZ domain-containing protein [Bacillota bacterium]